VRCTSTKLLLPRTQPYTRLTERSRGIYPKRIAAEAYVSATQLEHQRRIVQPDIALARKAPMFVSFRGGPRAQTVWRGAGGCRFSLLSMYLVVFAVLEKNLHSIRSGVNSIKPPLSIMHLVSQPRGGGGTYHIDNNLNQWPCRFRKRTRISIGDPALRKLGNERL
jgi:hypothetical protein